MNFKIDFIIFALGFIPPLALIITGLFIRKKQKTASIILFILAAIYLITLFGTCGPML